MSYNHLTLNERRMIEKYYKKDVSIRNIAYMIGRSASTISRELYRNQSAAERKAGEYSSRRAQKRYVEGMHWPRKERLTCEDLYVYVNEKLMLTYSPEQVSGRIKLDYPDDTRMRVSYTTIYRWLRSGRLSQAASIHLRHGSHRHGDKRGQYHGIRSLSDRSRLITRRKRFGDWELDTILSARNTSNSGLLSMYERKSHYCVLAFLKNLKAENVYHVICEASSSLPVLSLTTDRGKEFACYAKLERDLQANVFFCAQGCPWQKGGVENLNCLVREFFPRRTDFATVSSGDICNAMQLLNDRPRKSLGFRTPSEVLLGF